MSETTVESAADFFVTLYNACVEHHFDGETWDTDKAIGMIRERAAAVRRQVLEEAAKIAHKCAEECAFYDLADSADVARSIGKDIRALASREAEGAER